MVSRSLVRTRPPRVRTAVNVHPIWKASMPSSTLRPGLAHPAPALATASIAATERAPDELAPDELAGLRLVEVPDAAPPYDGQADGDCGGARVTSPEQTENPGLARAPAAGTRGLGAPASGPAAALAVVIVEALAGVRPERQLLPLTTDRVRARIRRLAPLLRCDQRPRVLRILASQPAPRVVEMAVVAAFGPRSRALALRLEQAAARPATPGRPVRPARWRCTAIEAG
jgi:hypothetical protein